MSDLESSKRFTKIEERLTKLESAVFSEKKPDKTKPSEYTGLSGGIRLLIKNGFFDTLREVNEVILELKNNNYHYPNQSIAKILRVDFATKQRLLNKIKAGHKFKYVIRK